MTAIVNDPLPPPPSSKHPYFRVLVAIGLLIWHSVSPHC
jgi:hypothetical protein